MRERRFRVAAARDPQSEPIAVVGLACRFPGSSDAQSFWQLLRAGRDAIIEVPGARWDVDAFYDSELGTPGKMNSRWGGFLDRIDEFDRRFFGISRGEAAALEPQQRVLLEVSWEALEAAGISAAAVAGSPAGVFVGITKNDPYSALADTDGERYAAIGAYTVPGDALCVAVNRVSYALDLRGPSLAIDTGCSASLVAVHQACQSLRLGESTLALAGGVHVILSPRASVALSQASMLAPDGRCKSFDAAADGYVRSEGCGIVVLKRLSDAVADRDNVLALICGSAVNHNGHGERVVAPSPSAQEAVIRQALRQADLGPDVIDYIEAHGVGTPAADRAEARALEAVFGVESIGPTPRVLGAVKTNIGHSETAAGIASLIKVILAMHHEEIPPNLHFQHLPSSIDPDTFPFLVPRRVQPWPRGDRPRVAGVNSFGLGGVNAHVVVREPLPVLRPRASSGRPMHLLTMSAKSAPALQALVARYRQHLEGVDDEAVPDVCFTANTGRVHFTHRVSFIASSSQAMRERMLAFESGVHRAEVVSGQAADGSRQKVAFLFPGEESYTPGMGRAFYRTQPTFRKAVEECDAALRSRVGPSFDALILSPETVPSEVDATDRRLVVFAVEYALARLWRTWGIGPDVVLGQGVGELAAACVAGVLGLADAITLAGAAGQDDGTTRSYGTPGIAFISGLTGRPFSQDAIADSDYWRTVCRGPARLGEAMQAVLATDAGVLIALGADDPFAPLRWPSDDRPGVWLRSLAGPDADWPEILSSLAQLYVRGLPINWSGFDGDDPRCRVELPTYPFQREKCWISSEAPGLSLTAPVHTPPRPETDRSSVDVATREPRAGARWRYELRWRVADRASGQAPDAERSSGRGPWVIVHDRGGAGRTLQRLLEENGDRCVGIAPLASVANPDGECSDSLEVDRVLQEAVGDERAPCQGIVYLGALDLPQSMEPTAASVPLDPVLESGGHVLRSLAEAGQSTPSGLWLVTRGVPAIGPGAPAVSVAQAPLWGAGMTLGAERPALRCVRVDLDPAGSDAQVIALRDELASCDREDRVAYRGGRRYVARLTQVGSEDAGQRRLTLPEDRPFELAMTRRGTLEGLEFRPAERRPPRDHEVEIRIASTALNFRDVLIALGTYAGHADALGLECAGVVTGVGTDVRGIAVGDEVVAAFTEAGSFRSFITLDSDFVEPKPRHLSFEEAVTIPIAFLTADYALRRLANISTGDRVLIHAAAGGVGQAAVQLAQRAGAEIFATAGSAGKRAYLTSLGIEHVMDSRSVDFVEEIRRSTDGHGVDVVLNCLTGASIPASLSVLAPGGKFLEIGKADIWDPARVAAVRPDVSYTAFDLGDVSRPMRQTMLREVLRQVEQGALKPIPHRGFPIEEIGGALRLLAGARHVGKVVVSQRSTGRHADTRLVDALRADATYLVTCGRDGGGLRVARWMMAHGARHLAIAGEFPTDAAGLFEPSDGVLLLNGVQLSSAEQLSDAVARIRSSMPPLRGVVHAAAPAAPADPVAEHATIRDDIQGALNLHVSTRDLELDFFVLIASTASWITESGEGRAAVDAFLDALSDHRRATGLRGVTLKCAPATIGSAPDTSNRERTIDPDAVLCALDDCTIAGASQQGVVRRSLAPQQAGAADGAGTRFCEELAWIVPQQRGLTGHASRRPRPHAAAWETATAVERKTEALLAQVLDLAADVLDIDSTSIDPRLPMKELGLDSLKAVELRNLLVRAFDTSLPATLLFDYPTPNALTGYLAAKASGLTRAAVAAPLPPIAADEPIAIVGASCRFPGGATDLERYWTLLHEGTNAIREVPRDRWDIDAYYDPDPDAPGKMYSRHGGFLRNVADFDAAFFRIAPREALSMDPQQRLLLEVSWEALESAGQAADELVGTQTGVFIGICASDYADRHFHSGDPLLIDTHSASSAAFSAAVGRVSYLLGFQGPNLAIDTACSSSLVAVHLACQSLRTGESSIALAGGVNLSLSPEPTVAFSKARFMSPDGQCKTFDASANGYVRGEGCGVVVLKRLSEAERDGDAVLAVIRGSAVNQDGRSSGLTAPNGLAQEKVVRTALANAAVEPLEVSYVEAHGTGTPLGDPIEMQALGAALCAGRGTDARLVVGSVKTNIGHLEAAAGIAGLIKVVLALQHEWIPPHLHFTTPNPYIPWQDLAVTIPTAGLAWPRDGRRRVAGVSSFGFSGTNAHVVVAEAPASGRVAAGAAGPGALYVLPLSARSEAARAALVTRYREYLGTAAAAVAGAGAICYTASVRRSHHEYRLTVVGETCEELGRRLEAVERGEGGPAVAVGRTVAGQRPKVAWVFGGQGSQWAGMGRELLDGEPVFRAVVEECDALLRRHAPWSLLAELDAPEGTTRLAETAIAQPAIFAIQMGLAALWRSWGVVPDAVIGHSMGEVAAATVAGGLTLAAAVEVIYHRGRVMQGAAGAGAMVSVSLPRREAEAWVAPYGARVTVAAVNGPAATVLAGEPAAVAAVVAALRERGVSSQALKGSYAFHSAQMDPLEAELRAALAGVEGGTATIPLVSTVTGREQTGPAFDAAYWWQNIRQPVEFAAGVATLLGQGVTTFVEVGPQPVLAPAVLDGLEAHGVAGVVVPSLRRGRDSRATLRRGLGALYCHGVAIDWRRLHPDGGPVVPLPTYPFQRQRFWIERRHPDDTVGDGRSLDTTSHALLGKRIESATEQVIFESRFSVNRLPFLQDHKVFQEVVVPGSCLISLALTAALDLFDTGPHSLEDITFLEALVLPDDVERIVQLIVTPTHRGAASYQVFSRGEADGGLRRSWTLHATGKIRSGRLPNDAPRSQRIVVDDMRGRRREDSRELYEELDRRGIQLGPRFQWVTRLWRGGHEAVGEMTLPEAATDAGPYALYPGLVDSCFQLLCACLPSAENAATAYVPIGVDRMRFEGPATGTLWCRARIRDAGVGETHTGDLLLVDGAGDVVAEFIGLQVKRAPRDLLLRHRERIESWLYEIEWQRLARAPRDATLRELQPTPDSPSGWLVFADASGVGREVARTLALRGERVVEVYASGSHREMPEGSWQLDPADPASFRDLLQRAFDNTPPLGIVHLWALDATMSEEDTLHTLLQGQLAGCGSGLHLIQALDSIGWTTATRLWLVTGGAQSPGASPTPISLAQTSLWGLGQIIAQEYPELRCVRIDLDPPGAMVDALLEEIGEPGREDQVALRGTDRYVPRLVRRVRDGGGPPSANAPVDPDGTYLITGGCGGLGLAVARWLVQQGARHLALLGRSGASEAALEPIAALRNAGAHVMVCQADVGQPEDVAQVLADIRAAAPRLRGIVHAAGLLDDDVLLRQSWQRVVSIMAPKVLGAWNLHVQTRDLPLDFFVVFSSVASVLGSIGQGSYAAANAMMDGFAHYRRARGLCALSVNWGPWGEVGMATRVAAGVAEAWVDRGIDLIAPDQGLHSLGYLLETNATQTTMLLVNWTKFLSRFPADQEPLLLAELARQLKPSEVDEAGPGRRTDFLRQLDEIPVAEREEFLLTQIRRQASRILGFDAGKPLDPRQPLNELGLDSLLAVQLRDALGAIVGRTLPATLLFNYPTLEALGNHLAQEFLPKPVAGRTVEAEPRHIVEDEPIALIGMACRFPGGADNPERFWHVLSEGVDTIAEIPAFRWDADRFYDPDPEAPGKMYTRHGAFLGDVSGFDAAFFGIAPREVVSMDPQQRLLLEVSWEALENAGQPASTLAGTDTGVFVGIGTHDYGSNIMHGEGGGPSRIDAYYGTGNTMSVASGRLSYVMGLQGPSMALDTACSSSLVAVHLACQSLRSGESSLALAGGVNLTLTPENTIYFSKLRALAPDGRCKTFDASANGYARGEGCGVVVLKRLSEAERDGDAVLAVIRGSAVNQDGRSSGLTAPNGLAQEKVIRTALARADVQPLDVGYVEAHGTGTPLGDPIEMQALGATLCEGRSTDARLVVGSVKTNIGHLEAAAGIAGLIKVVLALQHEWIPAHLHYTTPSPYIPWETLPVTIPTTGRAWPRDGRRRVAGVSSFGFSGTNAHVVVAEAPASGRVAAGAAGPGALYVLPLSARSEAARAALVTRYREYLGTAAAAVAGAGAICYTASVRRSHHEYRLTVVGETCEELGRRLEAVERGEGGPAVAVGRTVAGQRPKVAWVFGGQGSQWAGMGRELLDGEPVFRAVVEECDALLRRHAPWSLLAELDAPEGTTRLAETAIAQPAIFAIQMGLAALWRSWGVVPDAVIGHSMGEVAAATVAGGLTLAAAVEVIYHRGRVMQGAAGAGAMVSVSLPRREAEAWVAPYGARVTVAAVNGPAATVLAGEPAAVAAVVAALRERGVSSQALKGSYAFHSAQMDPLEAELRAALAGVEGGTATIPLVSTVTGREQTGPAFDAAYWWQNIRQPVEFAAGVATLLGQGVTTFVEVGPQPVLAPAVLDGLEAHGVAGVVVPSLRRGRDSRATLRRGLGALYCHGVAIDWRRLHPDGGPVVPLPTYPFQRQRFWIESSASDARTRIAPAPRKQLHPLLGGRVRSASTKDRVFEGRLDAATQPFLNDHRVYDVMVVPAVVYLELARAAGVHALAGAWALENVLIHEPMVLADHLGKVVQTIVRSETEGSSFEIFSVNDDGEEDPSDWTLHASGTFHRADVDHPLTEVDPAAVQARCRTVTADQFYQRLETAGISLGPAFQGIKQLWWRQGEALARLQSREALRREADGYHVAPALLDCGLQLFAAPLLDDLTGTAGTLYLPVSVDRLRFHHQPDAEMWAHVAVTAGDPSAHAETLRGDVSLFNDDGSIVAALEGVWFKRAERTAVFRTPRINPADWLYEVGWEPQAGTDERASSPDGSGGWLILSDSTGIGAELVRRLEAQGEAVVSVCAGGSRRGDTKVALDPAKPEQFSQLLRDAFGTKPPRGIVYLWALDAGLTEGGAPESLWEDQVLACGGALHLLHAISAAGWSDMPRLWLVTRGVRFAGSPADMTQASVWGLARTIALEHPRLSCVTIDLDPSQSGVDALFDEVLRPYREDLVAFNGGVRSVPRLMPSNPSRPANADTTMSLGSDGTYLVTGGLGALGLEVAGWMVRRGARHLVLVGRSAAGSSAVEAVTRLQQSGAEVVIAQADVARRDDVTRLVATIRETMPPLRGVVHAAGVVDDGVLLQQDWDRFTRVFAPKVDGAWNLHVATARADLDFFVVFSSAASVLGSSGQANYAAANAWLDGFARYRRAAGLCGLSINWGPWDERGMAARLGGAHRAQLRAKGFGMIPPDQGIRVLEQLLQTDTSQTAVLPVDWSLVLADPGRTPTSVLLSGMAPTDRVRVATERPAEPELIRLLREAPPRRHQELLADYLRRQGATILGLDSPDRLDPHRPLIDLGLDSLMALSLRSALELAVGRSLPATLVFEHPTLEAIAAYLATEVLLLAGAGETAPDGHEPEAPRVDPRSAEMDEMSEEDAETLLVSELDNLERLGKP